MKFFYFTLLLLFVIKCFLFGVNSLKLCKENKCFNGGLCSQTSKQDYKCDCPNIYSGKNCENCICFTRTSVCSKQGDGICNTLRQSISINLILKFLFLNF